MALLGILKMVPRALALLLCRSGLLPRLSPFCRLASHSVKEVVERLTANRELQAVLSYIFPTYGRHRRPPEKLRNKKKPPRTLVSLWFYGGLWVRYVTALSPCPRHSSSSLSLLILRLHARERPPTLN